MVIDEIGVLIFLFIVFELDYLIDISLLVECFCDYGYYFVNYVLVCF